MINQSIQIKLNEIKQIRLKDITNKQIETNRNTYRLNTAQSNVSNVFVRKSTYSSEDRFRNLKGLAPLVEDNAEQEECDYVQNKKLVSQLASISYNSFQKNDLQVIGNQSNRSSSLQGNRSSPDRQAFQPLLIQSQNENYDDFQQNMKNFRSYNTSAEKRQFDQTDFGFNTTFNRNLFAATPKTKFRERLRRVQVIKVIQNSHLKDILRVDKMSLQTDNIQKQSFIKLILTPSNNTTFLRDANSNIIPLSKVNWQQVCSYNQNRQLYLSLFDLNTFQDITYEIQFISHLIKEISEDLIRQVKEWIKKKTCSVCLLTLYTSQQQNIINSPPKSDKFEQDQNHMQVLFHKILAPTDLKQVGTVPKWMLGIIKKFYMKIFDIQKRLNQNSSLTINCSLESENILNQKIYLEDENEINWIINLQGLFNSQIIQDQYNRTFSKQDRQGRNQTKPEITVDQGYQFTSIGLGNIYSPPNDKLQIAVEERKYRDMLIQQHKIQSTPLRKVKLLPVETLNSDLIQHQKRANSLLGQVSDNQIIKTNKSIESRRLSFNFEKFDPTEISKRLLTEFNSLESGLSTQNKQLLKRVDLNKYNHKPLKNVSFYS